jgi:hypothetical protein
MTAKIKLNAASGGGSVSIQAPSSSSNNRVISLPDIADGTLLTNQSTLDSTKLSPAIAAGITMADSWRITSNFNNNAQPITSNWERSDLSPWEGYLGSAGLTESSGVFSFPSTGWYFIHYSHDFYTSSDVNWVFMGLDVSNDSGSNWSSLSYTAGHNGYGDGDTIYNVSCQTSLFDITNVSTQRMRFYVERQTGTVVTMGSTNRKQTGFDIFRLGDT